MLASVITFLIYICVLALVIYVIYLIIWVLRDVIGLPIPPKVIQILWVILALIVILWLVQTILPGGGGMPHFLR